ncbi:MAG TPA: hypothetical protein VIP08_04920 [Phenylobacterium sp.]|uniref:hypothetical protein n=1 Tax=Phenylobacterium sp. TaxID=1871053 RepID=UPI002F9328D6
MQRDRDHDALEDQCDAGGNEQMRGGLDVGLPGHGHGQHDRMQSEGVEQAVEAILVQHQEAHQHHGAGEQVGDIEIEAVH